MEFFSNKQPHGAGLIGQDLSIGFMARTKKNCIEQFGVYLDYTYMQYFIADIDLKDLNLNLHQEILLKQKVFNERMLEEGIFSCCSVSIDSLKIWLVFVAPDVYEAEELVKEFPIFPIIEYKIHPLVIHKKEGKQVPQMWLN